MTKCRAGFTTDRDQIKLHPSQEISPPQYHIYIDNTFRACGKDSPIKNHEQDPSTSQLESVRFK